MGELSDACEGDNLCVSCEQRAIIYPVVGEPDPPGTRDSLPDQVSVVRSLSAASLRVFRVDRQELAVTTAQYHVKLAPDVPVHQLVGDVLATLRRV